ncbi:MAG: glycoside hydrolase family 18 protein [Clostridium sp.]|jgi:hypothetical protein|nr:glycoside hydrolase family 18 protein [Clostridium sp.]
MRKKKSGAAAAIIGFGLAALAAAMLLGADWAYPMIAELYPLGSGFITLMFGLCILSVFGNLLFLLATRLRASKPGRVLHALVFVLSGAVFVYCFILSFGLDKALTGAYTSAEFMTGLRGVLPLLPVVLGAVLLLCLLRSKDKKLPRAIFAVLLALCLAAAALFVCIPADDLFADRTDSSGLITPVFTSTNLLEGASVTEESLQTGESPDAVKLLCDDEAAWTPQPGMDNSFAEIKLRESASFNTAVIEELGNQVQYFRLQAFVDGKWKTIYQSEKIQSLRLCSFDTVTTDRIRLSIDKFRGKAAAEISSLRLYNEQARPAEDFNVTVYQRLDGDVPSQILKLSEEEIDTYARYYDVYSTVLVFGAVNWQNDEMGFGFDDGETGFARELSALKELISRRSNKEHQVKLVCTALADGAWGDGHNGVNVYMKQHWETIADKMLDFMKKYDLDGLDIDWEYPVTAADWECYDKFIERLDEGMKKIKPDAILSAALSAGQIGMSKETLARFEQIQYMAYDGNDEDGYQSSLEQAQRGLLDFVEKGVDLKQVNIGIAAYGRPLNAGAYWAKWREVQGGDSLYWNSLQYNVTEGGQLFDGAFCSPALAGDKAAYALLSGVGGVMVFRLACDKTMDDPNAVACGLENTLKRLIIGW